MDTPEWVEKLNKELRAADTDQQSYVVLPVEVARSAQKLAKDHFERYEMVEVPRG